MCIRAACSCLHEVPISRAGVFVGIGLGRGQRLLYSRRRCTSSNTEHHELAAAEGIIADNAHIICGVHHVDCLTGITLESFLRYVL